MSQTTVAELAQELHKPTDTLLEQLASAGVAKKGANDTVTLDSNTTHKLFYALQYEAVCSIGDLGISILE